MREIFLEYAKSGAMTKEDLAKVLKISPDLVRRMAASGKIPKIKHIRFLRFDPLAVADALFPSIQPRSLTIEKHNSLAKKKGYSKCL